MSALSPAPLLSYIVLSYNYERYVGATIRSILTQSVQDFEIVMVDDASSDRSCSVIAAFNDPRIRLLVNDANMGGAWSYNRAVGAARGDWLVNLDADDWIAPGKAQAQMALSLAQPRLDIIGSYVSPVDARGDPHPEAAEIELNYNQPFDLNTVDPWIGRNPLCRSSTMVRRATHLRIGLDDPGMVRAPDYELWTRALRRGCRFAVIPERLTSMRVTASGVTHADPTGTLLEMSYAMLRNLVPLAEERALLPSLQGMIFWVAHHPQLAALRPGEAHRLVGLLMNAPPLGDFAAFRSLLAEEQRDPSIARIGRRCLALLSGGTAPGHLVEKLRRDIDLYVEARDYWHMQAQAGALETAEQTDVSPEDPGAPGSSAGTLSQAPREKREWSLRRMARRVSSRFFPTS